MDPDRLIAEILRREGGFVNHTADRGGPTKYGITQRTLAAWRGQSVTIADVMALTEAEARAIYRDRYVVQPRFDQVANERLRELLVDFGVHSGPARAAKSLQTAAGVPADGVIGPVTLAAVNQADAGALYRRVLAERLRFIGRLITDKPDQAAFAAGWCNRMAEFVEG